MRPDRAQIARDIAVARLARVNRWVTAGAFVAVGALTDVVAHAAPGHAIARPAAAAASPSGHRRAETKTPHHRRPVAPVHHHHHVDRPLRSAPAPVRRRAGVRTGTGTRCAPTPAPAPAAPAAAPVSGGS